LVTNTDYEKYRVSRPACTLGGGVKGRQSPVMTYLSNGLVPGCNLYIEMGWVTGMPEPNPHIATHTLDYDEIIIHIGGDPDSPRDLGAEVAYYVDGQPLVFDTTTLLYVPAGVPRGPAVWRSYRQPHIVMSIVLGPETTVAAWMTSTRPGIPDRTGDTDYEKYLVREPVYLSGTEVTEAIKNPAPIYLSSDLVDGCRAYIDFGWIYDLPDPNPPIPEHDHNYEEVVVVIGGDPDNPEDLGAELEFCIDSQPLTFDTTTAVYVTKDIPHGPLTWKRLDHPHILMPIVIGTGSLAEAAPAGYKEGR
jgi:hypothetical protein